MPRVGVVLAGCGAQDGSEIHESVLTLLSLDSLGAKVKIMAPEIDQFHVVNHLSNHKMDTTRNILSEAARIASMSSFSFSSASFKPAKAPSTSAFSSSGT